MHKETIGNATLYLGDCREIIPQIKSVDFLLTDPPYGIGEDGKRSDRNRKGDDRWKAPSNKEYGLNEWDASTVDGWLPLACGISHQQAIWGGNYYPLPPSKGWLIWDKETDGKIGSDCEMAWTNWMTSTKRLRWLWDGFRQKQFEERFHPTQKPVGVMQWCILQAGSPATIFDPFAGSGTTGVAAMNMGLKFIGCEIDRKHFETACIRIEQSQQQMQLGL